MFTDIPWRCVRCNFASDSYTEFNHHTKMHPDYPTPKQWKVEQDAKNHKVVFERKIHSFSQAMLDKLVANDHKEGWDNCDPEWLLERLCQEVAELREAVSKGEGILLEAADVANFALFIADVTLSL